MLLVGPAASAWGDAQVRFVQAVPGAGALQLEVKYPKRGQSVGAPVDFGRVGTYVSLPKGRAAFELSDPPGAGRPSVGQRLENGGRYTVVAVGGGDVTLRVLSDGPARPGGARLRAVHVAPELGGVEVRLGDQPVAQLGQFKDVADYTTVDPGAYAVRVTRPGDGSTLAAQGGVPLTAGTASTAFVLGTAGDPLQVVVAADRSATPAGAPQTGLGGLAGDGPSLLTALLAGLLAAAAGGAGYLTLSGRSRGRGT
jgi:hypothetical protein